MKRMYTKRWRKFEAWERKVEGPPDERLLAGYEIFWDLGGQRPQASQDRGGIGSSFCGSRMVN